MPDFGRSEPGRHAGRNLLALRGILGSLRLKIPVDALGHRVSVFLLSRRAPLGVEVRSNGATNVPRFAVDTGPRSANGIAEGHKISMWNNVADLLTNVLEISLGQTTNSFNSFIPKFKEYILPTF